MHTHLRRQHKSKVIIQLTFKQGSKYAVDRRRIQVHEANTVVSVALDNFSDFLIASELLLFQRENFLFFFGLLSFDELLFALFLCLCYHWLRFRLSNRFQEIGLHLTAKRVGPFSNSVTKTGPAWRFFRFCELKTNEVNQEWHVWSWNVDLFWQRLTKPHDSMIFDSTISNLDQQLISWECVVHIFLLVALDIDVNKDVLRLLDEVMLKLYSLCCVPFKWFYLCFLHDLLSDLLLL